MAALLRWHVAIGVLWIIGVLFQLVLRFTTSKSVPKIRLFRAFTAGSAPVSLWFGADVVMGLWPTWLMLVAVAIAWCELAISMKIMNSKTDNQGLDGTVHETD